VTATRGEARTRLAAVTELIACVGRPDAIYRRVALDVRGCGAAASGSDAAVGYPSMAMTLISTFGPLAAAPLSATPVEAANDNLPDDNLPDLVPMPPRRAWDVYRITRRGRFVGSVFATDADAAIRAAAVAFDADIRKLIAMPRG
jgi:hypothetical protein